MNAGLRSWSREFLAPWSQLNILLVLYFLQFYIGSYLTNSQEPEPHIFGPMDPLEKNQEQESEPLWKKSRAEAAFEKQEAGAELKIIRLLSP